MSTQPEEVPAPPAPAAAARLLLELRADRRAEVWVPAFEQDWARALDDARHSYSLAPLHTVVNTWRARLAAAPAVEAFLAGGCDDSDGLDLDQVLGTRA
ncbi:DUF6247 family protein [Streptomyces sp. NPDC019826]|uniref:DUF6247 family protein n=1 Tax=Streptomyces TaxID=1883 RepID=UPI0029A2E95E|nr:MULTISPECIES: DUF6247 family protein [unclassified Streptomyces]MDX3186477.1 DUF6247 family protein [Streptomyces sp. ME02-7008A-1]MDX3307118.1 DUF6247 family protein [Streptomyces sp. ME02-7008A]